MTGGSGAGEVLLAAREPLTRGNAYPSKHRNRSPYAPSSLTTASSLTVGTAIFDCGLAATQMMLKAIEIEVIAHPMASYRPEIMREAFQCLRTNMIAAMVPAAVPMAVTASLRVVSKTRIWSA